MQMIKRKREYIGVGEIPLIYNRDLCCCEMTQPTIEEDGYKA